MKTTIKQAIVATQSKEWKPYVNKNGEPFKMLHIELEDWRRASKYFNFNDATPTLEGGKEYDVELVQNGQYYNIASIRRVVSVDEFIEAAKQYGFGLDEEQTRKMADDMEWCETIAECEDVVLDYMEWWALDQIRYEIWGKIL